MQKLLMMIQTMHTRWQVGLRSPWWKMLPMVVCVTQSVTLTCLKKEIGVLSTGVEVKTVRLLVRMLYH